MEICLCIQIIDGSQIHKSISQYILNDTYGKTKLKSMYVLCVCIPSNIIGPQKY